MKKNSFERIFDALQQGEVVHRRSWPEWQILFFRSGRYHLTDRALVDDIYVPVISQITLTSLGSELLADDWELVKKGE